MKRAKRYAGRGCNTHRLHHKPLSRWRFLMGAK